MRVWPVVCLSFLAATSVAAQDDSGAPLSAIDWLSQSVAVPVAAAPVAAPRLPDEPPIARSGAAPEITVTSLDQPGPRAIGLLDPAVTGLPLGLWSQSDTRTLVDLIQTERSDAYPAMHDLLVTLLLAQADAPAADGAANALLLARVDKLLDLGDLEPARALLEAAGVADPQIYRRWFDVALLTGTEDRACEELRSRPALAPTYPARIFCLARNGDWTGAALTLNTARALGDVTDEEDALLSRFLDPAISEGAPDLPPPSRLSPLVYLMREAIGEPVATAGLPLAFAHTDLRATVAWRSQMEAAEKLARNGAVSEDQLRSIYMLRTPAASGGVWDRAEAIQRFDTAVRARDPGAVSATLPPAWEAMQAVRTEVAFARLYAGQIAGLPLSGAARQIAITMGLLSPLSEETALDWQSETDTDLLLKAIARGDMDLIATDLQNPREAAIFAAFSDASMPEALAASLQEGRLGEVLLLALNRIDAGISGDQTALTEGLATLRAVGLEGNARQIALQLLLLERSS